jgi:hypothetical protein
MSKKTKAPIFNDDVKAFFARAREHARKLDRGENLAPDRAAKLEALRQDIRQGLESGPATPWDAAEVKRLGRERRNSTKAKPRALPPGA